MTDLSKEATKLNKIMEQAQVFASAWSLVGGRFDNGNMLDEAEAAKSELRQMVAEALAEQPAPVQQEPVALDGQRKLVQILAENWRVWPARKSVEQTSLGDVYCSEKGRDLMFGNHEIASDQDSAVVTKEMWSTMREALAEQPAPVAYIEHHKAGDNLVWDNPGGKHTPLYTSPPAQRKPLTRQQVKEMMVENGYDQASPQERADFINGLRHGEAAHNIKENT